MEAAQILDRVVARFIGTKHERDIKKLQPAIAAINAREAEVRPLSNEELKTRFAELRVQVQEQLKDADPAEPSYKEELQKALEPAIVPAFALVREAGRRFVNMRHFDVQLIGGIVLHEGKISEMKTGEGKTIVAPLACYLAALEHRKVHVVTVNDYLVQRDRDWVFPFFHARGMTVGAISDSVDQVDNTADGSSDKGIAESQRTGAIDDESAFSAALAASTHRHYGDVFARRGSSWNGHGARRLKASENGRPNFPGSQSRGAARVIRPAVRDFAGVAHGESRQRFAHDSNRRRQRCVDPYQDDEREIDKEHDVERRCVPMSQNAQQREHRADHECPRGPQNAGAATQ